MRYLRLHRFRLALLLGLLALTICGISQNQLSSNVLTAALSDAGAHNTHDHPMSGHFMPDGTYMPGPMAGHADDGSHDGGHTHKGHADCAVCGVVAAMAGFTVPVVDVLKIPEIFAVPADARRENPVHVRGARAPYASRAPPGLTESVAA